MAGRINRDRSKAALAIRKGRSVSRTDHPEAGCKLIGEGAYRR